nr:type VII secretion-associated serine protease mycosin [Pilimelia terevasa]
MGAQPAAPARTAPPAAAVPPAPAVAARAPGAATGAVPAATGVDGPGGAGGAPAAGADGGQARREQWQLGALRARAAWRYATGSGVTVAVVDSGVDAGHPDLAGRVLPGLDLVDDARDGRYDAVGHGTTVAGLIAGRADDGDGVVGLAPGATILPVRVLDADNRYDDAGVVAQGVRWAVDRGARVVNISLGGGGGSEALAAAVRYAADRDVVVVACTGNLGPGAPADVWFPARYPGVVAVSGLNRDLATAWRSAVTGPATALAAPATSLVGARPGGYWTVQGTSFAAPLVAATAALVRSRWPDLPAHQVVARLLRTAEDLGPAGRDATYGYGAVDPLAALTRWVAPVAANPLDSGGAAVPPRGAPTARLAGAPAPAGDAPPADPRLPVLTLGVLALVTAALRAAARRALVTAALRAAARRAAAPLPAEH